MITYIDPKITVDQLRYEMMVICRFSSDQDFTMKWVDEEGNYFIHYIVNIKCMTFNILLLRYKLKKKELKLWYFILIDLFSSY